MATISITEQVHVDIRIDGVTISNDFAPGITEVEQPVADLLIAQGLATVAVAEQAKPSKKTSSDKADEKPAIETPEA